MNKRWLVIVFVLAACGKEPPPKVLTMSEVRAATLGGWESGCLPSGYADTPVEGALSVRWLLDVVSKDISPPVPEVSFRQILFSDAACTSPMATVRTVSWGEIAGNDATRFTLKLESYSTYLTVHSESVMKRYTLDYPDIIAKHLNQEYFIYGHPYSLDRSSYGTDFLFGGEIADGKLTLFPPAAKQFSGQGARKAAPQAFQNPVPMQRRY